MKIFFPPLYERTVWHYQQADTELIKRSLENFDWKNAFSNCNPNKQVYVLTKIVLNIMSNFIPNETMMVDDRDPPWISNDKSKRKIYFTLHEDKFVANFQAKSEIFNSHFAKQCSLLKNESRISPQLLPHTNACFSAVRFSGNAFLKVI